MFNETVTYTGMEVPLIITKLMLNTIYFTDIKYFFIFLACKCLYINSIYYEFVYDLYL